MPLLLINSGKVVFGVEIDAPVHIGRFPWNEVVIDNPKISRLHAWVHPREAGCIIQDVGSRTGTFVNDERINTPQALLEGDLIRIGDAQLRYYHRSCPLNGFEIKRASTHSGKHFWGRCSSCHKPFVLAAGTAGQSDKCSRCQGVIKVPDRAPVTVKKLENTSLKSLIAPVVEAARNQNAFPKSIFGVATPELREGATAPAVEPLGSATDPVDEKVSRPTICSVCQCEIEVGEAQTLCAKCGQPYHNDCWNENFGCATYGCTDVNKLKAGPDLRIDSTTLSAVSPRTNPIAPSSVIRGSPQSSSVPYLFLTGSIFGSLLSLVICGLPSLVVLIAFCIYLGCTSKENQKAGLAAAVFIISLLGLIIGIYVGWHIWGLGT